MTTITADGENRILASDVAPAQESAAPVGLLLCAVATLLALGAVMVFSVISPRASTLSVGTQYLLKHALWMAIGVATMLALSRIDYRRLAKHHRVILALAVLLLAAVLEPHIGTLKNGARRWIRLGSVGFQPSELAKLAVLISVCAVAANRGRRMREFFYGFVPCVLIVVIPVALILMETDVGTGALVGAIGLTVVMVAGAPMLPLFAAGLAGIAGLALVIWRFPQRVSRLTVFLDPWDSTSQAAYQVQHSLISLGAGGLFGRGLGASRQKLYFLPEPDTDFILAVTGEELGLAGTLLVLFLFVLVMREGMRISARAKDEFGALLAFGITCMIGMQALIHIAVVTASMPTKGIALPFVSSGGSSMVVSMAGIGLLLSIARFSDRTIVHPAPNIPLEQSTGGRDASEVISSTSERTAV